MDRDLEYRPGKSNANADGLLGMPIISAMPAPKVDLVNMPELQSIDPDLAQLVNYLQTGRLLGNSLDDRNAIARLFIMFCSMTIFSALAHHIVDKKHAVKWSFLAI